MAATTTFADIITNLMEESGLGYVLPSYTGTTTTLTATGSYQSGPFTGSKLQRGAPILVTSTTGINESTFVSDYVPSTGVITVTPAITTGSSAAVLAYSDSGIDHFDRVKECINRALVNRCSRWQRMPLTWVPDGDLQGTTVSDYWTATSTTVSYSSPVFPTTGAAVSPSPVGIQRVLNCVTTSGTNQVQSNDINVPQNASTTSGAWRFQTAIRTASGTSGTVELRVIDVTNSAVITLQLSAGTESSTAVTNSRGWINISGTFEIPEDCSRIAFRLIGSASGLTYQMAPIIAAPIDARSFPLPNRVLAENVGNFYYGRTTTSPSGPGTIAYSAPLTIGGVTHQLSDFGDHLTVTFNTRPSMPIYYDELMYGTALSALTDTTPFPLDYVVKASKAELLKYLYNQQSRKDARDADGKPLRSHWKTLAIEAQREWERSSYEPRPVQVYGRR